MCCRRMRTHSEWKVQMVGGAVCSGGDASPRRPLRPLGRFASVPTSARRFLGSSLDTRSCISRAALLVKVTPRMWPGAIPRCDHVRDAEGNDPRLARAGAGKDQHRAANRLHGLSLLRVERTQIQHRARSLGTAECNASALPYHHPSASPKRINRPGRSSFTGAKIAKRRLRVQGNALCSRTNPGTAAFASKVAHS